MNNKCPNEILLDLLFYVYFLFNFIINFTQPLVKGIQDIHYLSLVNLEGHIFILDDYDII